MNAKRLHTQKVKPFFIWIALPLIVGLVIFFLPEASLGRAIGGSLATITLLSAGATAALASADAHEGRVQHYREDFRYLAATLKQLARLSDRGQQIDGQERRDAANGIALVGLFSASMALATLLIIG